MTAEKADTKTSSITSDQSATSFPAGARKKLAQLAGARLYTASEVLTEAGHLLDDTGKLNLMRWAAAARLTTTATSRRCRPGHIEDGDVTCSLTVSVEPTSDVAFSCIPPTTINVTNLEDGLFGDSF